MAYPLSKMLAELKKKLLKASWELDGDEEKAKYYMDTVGDAAEYGSAVEIPARSASIDISRYNEPIKMTVGDLGFYDPAGPVEFPGLAPYISTGMASGTFDAAMPSGMYIVDDPIWGDPLIPHLTFTSQFKFAVGPDLDLDPDDFNISWYDFLAYCRISTEAYTILCPITGVTVSLEEIRKKVRWPSEH